MRAASWRTGPESGRGLAPGSVGSALAVGAVLVGYLYVTPPVPDLAAQVARADVVDRVGETVWWLGWFGGVHVPTYSAITPTLMAALGAPLTGAVATAVAALAMATLLRSSKRPTAGAAAFLGTDIANLLDGRITFGVSMALGLCCLAAWRNTRSRALIGVLAVLTCLSSPLGGLFLGLAAAAVATAQPLRRRAATFLSLLVALTLLALAVMFPGAGEMPFEHANLVPALACAVAVGVCCPNRLVRVGVAGYLLLLAAFLAYPTAVGVNITRLAWVFTVPLLVAWGERPAKALGVIVLLAALFPGVDLAAQLDRSNDRSAHAAFYRPLVAALHADQAAHPRPLAHRVEVVDTRSHWASVHVGRHFLLARGWDRQRDRAYNPLFYGRARLHSDSYRAWLDRLAVGWVAVPSGPLDYASVGEAKIIATQPRYLLRVWSNDAWTLYRVRDATSLVESATVLQLDDRGVTFKVRDTHTIRLAVRWSPYLVITPRSGGAVRCLDQVDGWVRFRPERPGTYRLTADFDGNLRHAAQLCR